jgi:transcriptional regulator with XRE-family HTH domain
MPRASKRLAPDTLGGRLRTARPNLHLSLVDVANHKYSISLLSQIECNHVDPSTESLLYLAECLQLPYDDLQVLARRQPALALAHFNDKELKLDQLPLFSR